MNCGVCHGVFGRDGRDPLMLPACGHSLCRPCLALLTMHRGFRCPICREKQPHVDLSSLHPNHALLEVLAALKEENGRQVRKTGKEDSNGNKNSNNSSSKENYNNDKSKESVCLEHGGARLAYWCGACDVAACGECVLEGHAGGGEEGGRGKNHEAKRFDAALREKRNALLTIVEEVTESVERAEERSEDGSQNGFVRLARRLLADIDAAIGKLRLASSFLACQVQDREDEAANLGRLRQEMDELLCQVPPASTSPAVTASLAELRAVVEYLKEVEKFHEGPVKNMLKERTSRGAAAKESHASLAPAVAASAAINAHAAALCRKVACSGREGRWVEVVGSGGGRVGRVSWRNHYHSLLMPPTHHQGFHIHCLHRPLSPRPSPTHPSRRHRLKWTTVQTMMPEVRKVFLVVAWGREPEEKWMYFTLHPFSTSPHRFFISLLLGDDVGDSSLLGPLFTTVEEVVAGTGVKGICLGTYYHYRREDQEGRDKEEEHRSESKAENAGEDEATESTTGQSSLPCLPSAGDVVCVREEREEDDKEADSGGYLQFWLVTEGWRKSTFSTSPVDGVARVEVVGSLLPVYHHHQPLLGKLPGLVGVRVEDCGVVLPCDDEGEGVGTNTHHHPHPPPQPALRSRGVQTEEERGGLSVLGVVRRTRPDTHSPLLSLRPMGSGKTNGEVDGARIGEIKDSNKEDEEEEFACVDWFTDWKDLLGREVPECPRRPKKVLKLRRFR